MEDNPLVSIIMPAYNAEKYIGEAIDSALAQDYAHWELLIINDGSTDGTDDIIAGYTDPRITQYKQENGGVAAARNHGLSKAKGSYFCFLDSDDQFPVNSVSARLAVFRKNPEATFVDGRVDYIDANNGETVNTYIPKFSGAPFPELIRLNRDCYFGSTWMVKIQEGKTYQFNESMTHSEDLLFCIEISPGGYFDFTEETILRYRVAHGSAMTNLKGLENGYKKLIDNVVSRKDVTAFQKLQFRIGCIGFMSKSYLRRGKIGAGIRTMFRFLFT